jgi:hypothetical protein
MPVEEEMQKKLDNIIIPVIHLPSHKQMLKLALIERFFEEKKERQNVFFYKLVPSVLIFFLFFFFSINRLGDLVYPNVYAKELIDKTIEKIIEIEPQTLEEKLSSIDMLRLLTEARLSEDLQYEGVIVYEEADWILAPNKTIYEQSLQEETKAPNSTDTSTTSAPINEVPAAQEGETVESTTLAQDIDAIKEEPSTTQNPPVKETVKENKNNQKENSTNSNATENKEKKEIKKITYTDKKGNKKMLGINEKDNKNPVVVIDNQPPGKTGSTPGQSNSKPDKDKK